MRKILRSFVYMLAALAMPGFVYADDYESPEGLKFNLNVAAGTCSFTGLTTEGAKADSVTIPDEVSYNGKAYKVTSVATRACYNNRVLKGVKVGKNVEIIGDNAFYSCTNLMNATLQEGLRQIGAQAFYGCRKLAGAVLPDGLENVGNFAFYNGTALKAVAIPASVTQVGANPWGGCTGLEKFTVADGNKNYTAVDDVLFDKGVTTLLSYPVGKKLAEYTVPSTVKVIANNSARNNSNMTKVNFPEGLEEIGPGAFNVCKLTGTLTIPASVARIGERAFTANPNLTEIRVADGNKNYSTVDKFMCTKDGKTLIYGINQSEVTIPAGVETIAGYAFYQMINVAKLNLGNVKKIGDAAFYYCKGINQLTMSEKLEEVGEKCFVFCQSIPSLELPASVRVLKAEAFSSCTGMQTVRISEGVTDIGKQAFNFCSQLRQINFPASVKNWGTDILSTCLNLQNVDLAEGVASIPARFLYSCMSLKTLTIPGSVKEIGEMVFDYCDKLESIQNNSMTPQALKADIMKEKLYETVVLKVPTSAVGMYSRAEIWSKFKTIEGDDSGVDMLEEENGAEAAYYDMNGVRVENPSKGLYIKVEGKKASKVIFK